MKKKFLVLSLVLVLVLCSLSASVSLGGNVGYSLDMFKKTSGSDTIRYLSSGPALNGVVEYSLDDSLSLRGNVTLMYLGKAKVSNNSGSSSDFSENSGLAVGASIDAKYIVLLSGKVTVSAFGGLQALYSYVCKDKGNDNSSRSNIGIGLNGGGEVAYSINESVSLTLGLDASWMVFNTTKYLKSEKSRVSNFVVRPYVGALYEF